MDDLGVDATNGGFMNGSRRWPWQSVGLAVTNSSPGDTFAIVSNDYPETLTGVTDRTLRPVLGPVTIGP